MVLGIRVINPFAVAVPVTSHDLVLRVEEAALRFDRAGRVERGEAVLAPEIGMKPGGTNRVRTLFTSMGNEADRVGPT